MLAMTLSNCTEKSVENQTSTALTSSEIDAAERQKLVEQCRARAAATR